MNKIILADNLTELKKISDASVDLIYIDPPFNTGKTQAHTQLKTVRDDEGGDRVGFQGNKYRTTKGETKAFADEFDNFVAFLEPRLLQAYRVLKRTGSFFLHIDYREAHYCKVLLDTRIFGRECFMNEIIWAYDYGARSKSRWSAKHDNILWYVKDREKYTFNFKEMERIPYMAPGLVGEEKAARGKTMTDVWWHTIVPTNGKERLGYPTQKPLGILKRIIKIHSNSGDVVLDFFAGSGTTGAAALELGRSFILIDNSAAAIAVMRKRFAHCSDISWQPQTLELESCSNKGVQFKEKNDMPPMIPPQAQSMSVLAIGVSAYDNFQHLKGPSRDLEMIESIFSSSGSLGLVDPKRIRTKHNPTSDDIRKLIKEHADSKSASGDITIFYFSGHGCAYASGEFALCGKDARRIGINDSIDPMSVIKFADIIEAFRAMDIHPVFIIDACFSGLAALDRSLSPDKIPDSIARDLRDKLGGSYALLCACSSDQTAKDDMNGGLFTQTIFEICSNGLAKSTHKNQRFINLSDIDALINKKASKIGMSPLPRYYSGQLLSEVPLCKNIRFP